MKFKKYKIDERDTKIKLTIEERRYLNNIISSTNTANISCLMAYSEGKGALYEITKDNKEWAQQIIDNMKRDYNVGISVQHKLFPDSNSRDTEETFLKFLEQVSAK